MSETPGDYKYYLAISDIKFAQRTKPNIFHRFMHKLFFGITYGNYEDIFHDQ